MVQKGEQKGYAEFGQIEVNKIYLTGEERDEKVIVISNMFYVCGSGKHFCPNRNKWTL